MSSPHEHFSQRLRQARDNAGLSQSQLAEKIGLHTGSLSHLENRRRVPSLDILEKLSDELGVSVDWLLGRADIPQSFSPEIQQLVKLARQLNKRDLDVLLSLADKLTRK